MKKTLTQTICEGFNHFGKKPELKAVLKPDKSHYFIKNCPLCNMETFKEKMSNGQVKQLLKTMKEPTFKKQ